MTEFEVSRSPRPLPAAERAAAMAEPGFGQVFTDHMVTMRWSVDRGWHDGRLQPYGPLAIEPATSVLHYGQECFEGLKAYRQGDGTVALFRPDSNAARFARSARRLAMPEMPVATFVRALELLVAEDRDWVPDAAGGSLYLRPLLIATQRGLGFTLPSRSYLFCLIASPSAAYFGAGARLRPLTVWVSEDYSRAAPGGTGAAKVGGNYAAAFVAQREAVERGCDQVVWLDAAEHAWVEEMGGMNLAFVFAPGAGGRPRLSTPPLTDTLLPGVTRDSLLRLAPRLGVDIEEAPMSVSQWQQHCASGALTETFACGTAAVVAPVGRVRRASGEWVVGDGDPGPVTRRLREELLGIQHGRRPDPFGWVHTVC